MSWRGSLQVYRATYSCLNHFTGVRRRRVPHYNHLTEVRRRRVTHYNHLTGVCRRRVPHHNHVTGVCRRRVSNYNHLTGIRRRRVPQFHQLTRICSWRDGVDQNVVFDSLQCQCLCETNKCEFRSRILRKSIFQRISDRNHIPWRMHVHTHTCARAHKQTVAYCEKSTLRRKK